MATAENIAGSGLKLEHLKKIYLREREDGLQNTFTIKNSEGQPCVTNTKRTFESVIPKLAEYFSKLYCATQLMTLRTDLSITFFSDKE